ncbi:tape measure domain-containing protein, partial [Pseudomonas chengduensis]|nr:tape measure domain-containing protein [Pseudomonas chengduensis]
SPLTSSLGRWAAETQRASLQTQQAFLSQKAALQGLLERYQSGAIDARKFVQSANGMRHSLSLLDDSDLSGLESAIKSAKDQMQALTQSTQGTLNSMMDELDGLQGRTEDIERRRFQSRRQEL